MFETAQPAPVVLSAHSQLEGHRQHGLTGDAVLGLFAPVPDGGKGRFDGIGAADMLPESLILLSFNIFKTSTDNS